VAQNHQNDHGAAAVATAIHHSPERLMAIISSATDAIITVDQTQRITLFNSAAEQMFQCPAAEAIGQPLDRFIPDRFRGKHHEHIRIFGETGVTTRAMGGQRQLAALRADGTEFPVEAMISQISVDGEKLFTAILRDVSERRRSEEALRESEGRLRAIVETAVDGIITIDEVGNISSFNPAATRLFGYEPHEVMGKNVKMLMPAPYHDEHDGYLSNYRGTGVKKIIGIGREVTGRRKDGQTFPMELAVSETLLDKRRVFTGIVRDISERKREEQMRRARDEAESANRAKSMFLANMSHELRTPLNAIIGYSEILLEDLDDSARDTGRAADLGKIRAAGKQLLSLINDILDLSKIEAGKTTLFLEAVDVPTLVREVVTTVQPTVVKTGNCLEVDCPADVGGMTADVTKIRQTLLNLLSNGLKFTDHGTVSLKVSRRAEAGREWISFEVRDTGIGMTDEQSGRLFRVFSQADETTSVKYGGAGLGLAISQRLCRLMGGEITVSSELGKGSVFTARLPVNVEPVAADSAPTAPAPAAPAAAPLAVLRSDIVLVVDDDPIARDLLVRTLNAEGYNVRVATNGAEGLQLARKLKPMAITLDLMMPAVDGWTVLTELKGDPETADIPVVVITIVDDRGRAAGATLGASDFLTKPIDRQRLVQVLSRHRGLPSSAGPVLVVEDDDAGREMICRTLRKENWQIREATDGRAALAEISRQTQAAIVLDLMMPNMDGFEFVAQLRGNPAWRNIPVVVLTAKLLTEEDRRRLNGDVQKILNKGGDTREALLRELQQAIKTMAQAPTHLTGPR
jgi:ammonium transporter, Amt family